MKAVKKINLSEKFGMFTEQWNPKIVGELNGQMIKIAKLQGEFVMHQHAEEDEMFLVVEGVLFIEMEDETLVLKAGEFVVIPKGVNHKPYAPNEVKVMLFEPASTVNTGNAQGERTVAVLDRLID